jgi:hypothetical protein
MFFLLDGQEVVWVLNVLGPAVWTAGHRVANNTLFHGWWTNQLKGLFSAGIALTRIVTTNLDTQNAPQSTEVVSPPEAGLVSSGSTLPGGSALVMTHRTALRGRNYRGRTYASGLTTTSTATANSVTLTALTNLANAFFALIGLLSAVNDTWVVLSKFFAKNPRSAAVATPITAVSADQYLDSQRRRLTGRGV